MRIELILAGNIEFVCKDVGDSSKRRRGAKGQEDAWEAVLSRQQTSTESPLRHEVKRSSETGEERTSCGELPAPEGLGSGTQVQNLGGEADIIARRMTAWSSSR